MVDVTEKLPLEQNILEVLLDEQDKVQTPISIALRLVKLLENGNWHLTEKEASKINCDYKFVSDCYRSAVLWADFQTQ